MLLHHDHKAVVYSLAFSPDGGTLASGAKDGSLILRDVDGRQRQLCEWGVKTPEIYAIAHLPGGGVAIGHSLGWQVYGRDGAVFSPPTDTPTTALAVLDANTLAVGTGNRVKPTAGTLELWDLSAGPRRREPHFQEPNGVRAVATCPAKRLVAWATGHKKISVWDTSRQTPAHFPLTYNSPAIALSPDGSYLAAAVDWTVRVYDVAKKRERHVLKHKGQVTSLAFSPDGSTLATGGCDGAVKLWDAGTGRERVSFNWPIGRVYSLAYAPDGFRLAAGSDLGGVVVWDAE
jgi:WD40 repeat protein